MGRGPHGPRCWSEGGEGLEGARGLVNDGRELGGFAWFAPSPFVITLQHPIRLYSPTLCLLTTCEQVSS